MRPGREQQFLADGVDRENRLSDNSGFWSLWCFIFVCMNWA